MPEFTADERALLRGLLDMSPSPPASPSATAAAAGPSNEPPAAPAPLRGQPPLSSERVHRLVQARELLASGLGIDAVNQQVRVDKKVMRDVFDNSGRLRLSDRAAALAGWHEQDVVSGLRDLPRALTLGDARTLADLLRRHAAEPFADLRQAAVEAGMQPPALEYLFDTAGWLRSDRVDALPDDQRQALARAVERGQSAGAGAPSAPLPRSRGTAEAEIERAGRLIGAQAMLAAGQPQKLAVAHAGTDRSWLAKMLDKSGRLVLTAAGQRLIDCPDPALAAQFAALPRSLWAKDLHLLTELLQQHAAQPVDDLREAAAEAGVSPQALDYLLDDEGSLREDRIASLPPVQQDRLRLALEPADGARRGPAEVQHARTLADAQALLASGIASKDVARNLSMHPSTLNKVLDAQGRLLLVPHARRLLECPDPALAAQFAAVPRALRQRDLRSLAELLRLRDNAPADLRAAAVDRYMEQQAVDYLFDTEGRLRQDRLATLPDDQRQRLQAAARPQPQPQPQPQPAATAPASRRPTGPQPPSRPVRAPAPSGPARVEEQAPVARPAAPRRPATTAVPARTPRPAPSQASTTTSGTASDAAAARPAVPPVAQAQRPSSSGRTAPPVRPSSQMAGSAEASAVLQFFRRHPQPAQAFHEAQGHFRMSRDAVLQLLARAGVTELEAIGGQIPDAGLLWQRLRSSVRADRAPAVASVAAPVATPSEELGDFAASLEDMLTSPSRPSTSGKRTAEQAFGTEPSRRDRNEP